MQNCDRVMGAVQATVYDYNITHIRFVSYYHIESTCQKPISKLLCVINY